MPVTNNIKLVAKWKNVIDTDTYINDSWKNNTGNILEEKCTSSGFFTKTYSCSYSETQGTIYNLPTMTNQNLKIDIQAAYKKVDDVITNTSSLINSTKKLLGASGVQSIVLEYSDTTGSKTTITLNKGNVTNDNVYEKIKELFIAMTNTSKAENTSDRKLSSLNGKKFTLKVVASEDSIISKNKSSEIIYTVSFAATNHVVTNAYWQNFSSKIANNIISNYQKKETD